MTAAPRHTARTAGVLAGGLMASLFGACWSAPLMIETVSVRNEPPAVPTAEQPNVEPLTAPGPRSDPTQPDLTAADPTPAAAVDTMLQRELGGGARAVTRARAGLGAANDDAARLRIALPGGGGARTPGLTRLAARLLLDVAAAEQGRPSLRAMIARLGGSAQAAADATCVIIDLAVPQTHWVAALDAVLAVLVNPPSAQDALERVRADVAREVSEDIAGATAATLATLLAFGQSVDGAAALATIEDATPAELAAMLRQFARPAGAAVALWIPGEPGQQVLERVANRTQAWTATESSPTPVPLAAPLFTATPQWLASDADVTRLAFVLPLPLLGDQAKLPALVVHECLTLDGSGGRLATALRAEGLAPLALDSHELRDATRRVVVLDGEVRAADVPRVLAAFAAARDSLRRDPPRALEVRVATERVRLRLLEEQVDPRRWLEGATARALAGQPPADLPSIAAALTRIDAVDLRTAMLAAATEPYAVLAVGGQPPPDTRLEVHLVARPSATTAPHASDDLAAQRAAAAPWLQRAFAAVGGANQLVGVRGIAGELRRGSARGAAATERCWFKAPGHLRRLRTVLSTSIETVIDAEQRVEVAGADRVVLDEAEARVTLLEHELHPLIILAGAARGELRLRLVAVRIVQDRELVVLEIEGSRERGRLALDAQSGLVRRVDYHAWRADVADTVHVVEVWDDYRAVGSLRVPFHRVTTLDGGEDGVDTAWRELIVATPSDAQLRFGGPTELQPLQ